MRWLKFVLPVLVMGFFCFAAAPLLAKADASTTSVSINLDVEGPTASLFNQNVSVRACADPSNASSTTISGFCAFAAAGLVVDATSTGSGIQINSINSTPGNWQWFLNGNFESGSINNYLLNANDNILWALGREPLKVSLSTLSPAVNATTTVTVLAFNTTNSDFEPVAGASIVGTSLVTGANGTVDITATSTTTLIISVSATGFIPSQQFTITPKAPTQAITLTFRDASTTVFSGSVSLPDITALNITVTPTNSSSTIAVSPRSILGILEALEASSSSFNITNLAYSTTTNSFLINCVAVPANNPTPDCGNWTFAINGLFPKTSVDQQLLNNGDVVYFFLGSPHQTVLSATSVAIGQPFTASAQQFDLTSGNYKPLTGVTLGVGTLNPDSSFNEIATSTVDSNGQAIFTLNTAQTYSVGIKEDSYSPLASITITSSTTPPSSDGGGGGGVSHSSLNIANALGFISTKQNVDGSFSPSPTNDWAAIALAAAGSGSVKTKLNNYLLNTAPAFTTVLDNDVHAMALEAMGINPYSGTSVNYITAITNAFDGKQIGAAGDTDDIFALLALEHAGYTSSDAIIQQDAAFVLSTQHADGSWDGTPDMTAAAIQALGSLFDITGVNAALGQSAGYLFSTELPDGSWGNINSTSWVQIAINGIIEANTPGLSTENAWTTPAGFLPTDAVAKGQQSDGGTTSAGDRVLATSYSITAASGKSWVSILNSFPKPTVSNAGGGGGGGGGGGLVLGTSTAVTLIKPTASSTPQSTTSTIPIIIVLPTPTITAQAPTTTPTVIPTPKITKPRIKKLKVIPAVLGEATIQAQASSSPTPTATEPATPNRPGFLGRFWQSIASFFHHLF